MFHFQEKVYLPWSNQRYSIDDQGVIREDSRIVTVSEVDGSDVVELDWYDGKKLYRYDIVPVVCYFKIKIPQNNFDQIELIYKDSNKSNRTIDNLAYRFTNGPIESDDFPGFYYVPYYTDYVVNRTGMAIGLKLFKRRGFVKYKKWSVSKPVSKKNIKGGYHCGRAVRDHDGVNGGSRHRFLALTFIPYSKDPLSIVVNHKNGIPGDDRIDNLEWVTYSENTKHAYQNDLHHNKVVRILFLDENTGIEKQYPTIASCTEDTKFSYGFIVGRLKRPQVRYGDGIRVKYDDGFDWKTPEILRAPSTIRSVMAKNIFTDDIFIFENITKAEKHTGVKTGAIKYHCDNEPMSPTNGFSFRYVKSDVTWPHRSELHLRMYRRFSDGLIPDGLLLLDNENTIVTFYECLSDFRKEAGISEKKLLTMVKENIPWNGLRLRKFDVRGTL